MPYCLPWKSGAGGVGYFRLNPGFQAASTRSVTVAVCEILKRSARCERPRRSVVESSPLRVREVLVLVIQARQLGALCSHISEFEGDPFSYLRYAREMVGFYDAHVREPLFVFATRVCLGLPSQQDVAVGCASAFFSTLAVPAVFLLGARACSRRVGLAAAALFAIEPDVVRLSAEGWRDDAFALFR